MGTPDLDANVRQYLGDRNPNSRYASFDYCFNYFQGHKANLERLADPDKLQLSCLHLGFYLASWGMLRGSSELLKLSARSFAPVVRCLAHAPTDLWSLDADGYSDDACSGILDFARTLRGSLHARASNILVTKIMLGTMGCVPAFDTYFKAGFGVTTFSHSSLRRIGTFYTGHTAQIDAHLEPTLDFTTGTATQLRYTRAKVIDMIFFVEGMPAAARRRPHVNPEATVNTQLPDRTGSVAERLFCKYFPLRGQIDLADGRRGSRVMGWRTTLIL